MHRALQVIGRLELRAGDGTRTRGIWLGNVVNSTQILALSGLPISAFSISSRAWQGFWTEFWTERLRHLARRSMRATLPMVPPQLPAVGITDALNADD